MHPSAKRAAQRATPRGQVTARQRGGRLPALAGDDAVRLVYLGLCAVLTCESPGRR